MYTHQGRVHCADITDLRNKYNYMNHECWNSPVKEKPEKTTKHKICTSAIKHVLKKSAG